MNFLVLSLALVSGVAFSDTHDEMERIYSLQKLQQVASYLQMRAQSSDVEILKCDPSAEDAGAWLGGQLHALIDDKVPAEARLYKKNPKAFFEKVKTCHILCTCNAYAAILAATEKEMGKHPLAKKITKTLDEETRAENQVNCAVKLKWFCGSPLEKYLKGS